MASHKGYQVKLEDLNEEQRERLWRLFEVIEQARANLRARQEATA